MTLLPIFMGLIFLGIVIIVVSLRIQFNPESTDKAGTRRENRLLKRIDVQASGRDSVILKPEERMSNIGAFNSLLGRMSLSERLTRLIRSSNTRISVGQLLLIGANAAALGLAAAILFLPLFIALPVGLSAAGLPFMWLQFQRKKRFSKFQEQLPEALDLIARSLRAGHSLSAGIGLIADEMEEPISTEFSKVYEDYAAGKPLEVALDDMVERVPSDDMKFFSSALILQRETGGNLTQLLDTISKIIRDRFALHRKAKALSAEGRLSAIVLYALAPTVLLALLAVNPTYGQKLFLDPRGNILLGMAIIFQLGAYFVIRRIISLES